MMFDHMCYFSLKKLCAICWINMLINNLYSVVQSPGSKRSEAFLEPRETVVLTPKNVQVFVVCRVCSIYCKIPLTFYFGEPILFHDIWFLSNL